MWKWGVRGLGKQNKTGLGVGGLRGEAVLPVKPLHSVEYYCERVVESLSSLHFLPLLKSRSKEIHYLKPVTQAENLLGKLPVAL